MKLFKCIVITLFLIHTLSLYPTQQAMEYYGYTIKNKCLLLYIQNKYLKINADGNIFFNYTIFHKKEQSKD